MTLTSFEAAQALLAGHVAPLETEEVALADAANRVLAAALHASLDAPRAPVSAMDGYAVADASTAAGLPLLLVGEARPGAPCARTVGSGEAVRIFTGAPLPAGADRVIVQEHAVRDGKLVTFTPGYGPGRHIRGQGSDFRAGDLLLPAGTRLGPRALVAAAAADRARVQVHRAPRVALIATGDELEPPGSAQLRPYAVAESVGGAVAAMAAGAGALPVARGIVADELPLLERAAAEALARADLVIVSGGASVGEHDHGKAMFAPHGFDLLFSNIAIKPGKPVWCGRAQGRWVLGLPGNPGSALVTARLFLLPLLARLQGDRAAALRFERQRLAAPVPATGDRETFLRAAGWEEGLLPVGNQDSGAQHPLAAADWLIRLPAGSGVLAAGTEVAAIRF